MKHIAELIVLATLRSLHVLLVVGACLVVIGLMPDSGGVMP
jgi:hypothetical protein